MTFPGWTAEHPIDTHVDTPTAAPVLRWIYGDPPAEEPDPEPRRKRAAAGAARRARTTPH